MKRSRVLLVDDEPDLLDLLEMDMLRMGLDSARAGTVAEARKQVDSGGFDLCLTDMRLPDGDGLEIVAYIAEHAPRTPVAVITAFGSAENAVAALKVGAYDYVEKPVTTEKVRALVRSALKLVDPDEVSIERTLVGSSLAMRQVGQLIDKVARSQAPVFITGETGTGKEVAARLIHLKGSRSTGPFVAVNCGAIPENLMESEFFGYRKGAFTGADSEREGFFQAASGGTLFLDEVADLPLAMQVKLLRVIQEKRVRRIGGVSEEAVDVRVISASHQELAEAVAAGQFRHDLFYRLNVIDIRMPALRELREDLPELATFVLRRLAPERRVWLNESALLALAAYNFPGNVRELENILERALALSEGELIRIEDLNLAPRREAAAGAGATPGESLQDYLDRVERKVIADALVKTNYNKTAAARDLGITFRSLRYRIERLGME